ncbi:MULTISPECIES: beta family protein [Acinetobacter]|uniref:beta family protein n=1 Tax=Acinetobacter TaxID=469 RepID=UPI000679DD6C|nr:MULTISPECIES: hypothetical protein [Acinetobacter]MDQ8874886.1 hypothetical protein [Acinetobacter nosocomialis]
MSDFNYYAFLKFKKNEVFALNDLTDDLKARVSVFFDMPNELPFKSRKEKKEEFSPQELLDFKNKSFSKKIGEQIAYLESKINWLTEFYFDNYDIDPLVSIDGKTYNYQSIIDNFGMRGMIPVCGVDDRIPAHLVSIIESKKLGKFKTDKIAIRIIQSVFEDYDYIEDEFNDLLKVVKDNFSKIILIFDLRYIENHLNITNDLIVFFKKINLSEFYEIIITGSSLPKSVADLIETNKKIHLERKEVLVYSNIVEKFPNIHLGDYTCVPPDTNFLDLYIEDIASRMTGKIFYIYGNKVLVARSSRLKGQKAPFKPLLDYIVSQPFFRKEKYSLGDKYIVDKQPNGTGINASSILRPNINLHMSYMLRDFSI